MINIRHAMILSVCGCSAVSTAGVMSLEGDLRTQLYDISAETSSFPPDFLFDGTGGPVMSPIAFGDWEYDESFSIPAMSMSVYHSSSVTSELLLAEGSIEGTVTAGAANYAFTTGVGFNDFSITFSISETTEFLIDATLTASGLSGRSSVVIRNATSPFTVLYTQQARNTSVEIHETIELEAGIYSFQLLSDVSLAPVAGLDSASYSGSLSVIPAPSVLGMLGISGLLSSRRRR
jgi:hypothetical protein